MKPEVERVLVCGYYGFGNTGDEAILSVLVEDLRHLYGDCEISVLSGDPVTTSGHFNVVGIPWQSPADLIAAARRSDLMVLGGGGLIQDYNGFDSSQMLTAWHGDVIWAEFALFARMLQKPLAIYGVGVGPLHTEEGKDAARLVFSLAATASVRDQESLSLLGEISVSTEKIVLGGDPVFRLEPTTTQAIDSILNMEGIPVGERTVGVCLRPWRSGLPSKEIAAALDEIIEDQDARVVFLPFQVAPTRNENDSHAAHEVMLAMKRGDRAGIVRGAYGPREKLALFSQFDTVLAMRLHAAMFGLKAGKPTVAIAYDRKVESMMSDLGLSGLALPLEGLTSEAIVTTLEKAESSHDSETVARAIQELADRSLRNREALAQASKSSAKGRHEDGEVLEMLIDAAMARSNDAQLLNRARYESSLKDATIDHLRAELKEVHDSRAQQLARRYWKLRQDARETAAKVRSRLDPRARSRSSDEAPLFDRFNDTPIYGGPSDLRAHYAGQLEQILDEHRHAVGYALLPFSIGWRSSLFQRPQQMARALARQGYLVFYGLDHWSREQTDGFRQVDTNLFLYSVFPNYLDVLQGIPRPLTLTYAYNFNFVRHLREPVTVFEHIDELEVFTATHQMEHLIQWYEDAIENADIVVASAHDLLATVQKRRPDAFLCQNGVDFDHFAAPRPGPPPADLPTDGQPIVGYYGALAEWIDYDLLDFAAQSLPNFQFVFIGPNYDESMDGKPVFARPNVSWLGPKEYDELPSYLQAFSVATIPFVLNDVTHAVSPVKLHEYLAGGKPVVTTAMRETASYDVVMIGQNSNDWIEKLVEAERLSHDPAHVERLRMTARANTWDQRVGSLIDAAARLHLG
ncbi:MAG TPA: polysaccharide pyruvyl transferase family protein [Acidimicrobiia bacterium]|nr:polysaccharide pyruvyl transferase family protein [Acidimicrobiia bacterium]